AYDSLLAKLIAWGSTREEARHRMLRALNEYEVEGVPTTIPAHRLLLESDDFADGSYTTQTIEGGALDALMPVPVQPGTDTLGIVAVKSGDVVEAGQAIVVMG